MVSASVKIAGYKLSVEIYHSSRTLVYRGYRETDKKPVVIKLLKNNYPSFTELIQFRNQYTITKNLNFPSIIKPLTLEVYHNSYALVMEDDGLLSLSDYLKITKNKTKINKSLLLTEFLNMAIQLTDILHYLYQNRIIHKDIKPGNILINPDHKQIKLIDFSIASLLPRETQEIKNAKVLEGTLAYISPEQTGRMNRGIDYRSDFYSLGVTFYELLTGALPFSSEDAMELVHCHLAKQSIPIHQINPKVPRVLSEIVTKLMAKNAEDRYQSALGLKHDLETCLMQLQTTDKIELFEIGNRDISDRFLIPEKLYGREQEVAQLLASFERVSTGGTEIMLVAGFSGIGKTAVVNEVHKPIVRQRGYFIKGKYDQFQRNIPFSAFVQAFRDLMGQLLSESHLQLQTWKTKILTAMGDNGQVLIDVIPELEHIIGKQPAATELSGSAAQNRFNLLFQKFVQVFTSKEHPLVMFLDDLQWADSASLNLLQLLSQDTGYLLILGAYRDNEVSSVHPFIFTLNEIVKTGATVNTITLTPLSEPDLNRLVADTLNCELSLAEPLTKLVYQKTQGNPFFVSQFLKALHDDKLISFDWESRYWQSDIAQVKALAITNDVVDFMALQLQKLPIETQRIVKLSACIGAQFDLNTLVIVNQKSVEITATALWKALQEGLVIPTTEIYKFFTEANTDHVFKTSANPTYRFLHDRVQQAAYSLIPNDQKQRTHYEIGQLLLQKISTEAREEHIFEIVNQLNHGISLITRQTEREELAKLNLIACRKARTTTAYQAAREYSTVGLSLLDEKTWQHQYEMTLSLYELAVEVAFLCGDFAEMEQLIDIVIKQAHSLPEQVNVYRIRIQSYVSQSKFTEAIALGQQMIKQLGVTLIESPTSTDIQEVFQSLREFIGDTDIEDFVHLPMMTDQAKLAIIQIASSLISAALNTGSPLLPLLVALSVQLSIQHGNTAGSAFHYAMYGIILCNLLKDVDTAVRFGELAFRVVCKLDAKVIKSEVLAALGAFILHRNSHIKETLSISQEGYTIGLEVGNLEFAGNNATNFCNNSFWCGQPLATLEQDVRTYCHQFMQLHQSMLANRCRIVWQCMLNLLGFTEHPYILLGEAIQETEFLPLLGSANDLFGLYFFYLYKLALCFWFEEIKQATNYAIEVKRYAIAGAGTVGEPVFYFYDSLTILAHLSQLSDETSEALESVAQNQTELGHWAHYAPMNHQHKFDLVVAEKYRVLGKNYEAGDWYDRAISGAKENGYIQEEALANELAAKFYLNWGKEKVAAGYIIEAYYCYARWGAKAKVVDLETRYPQLLQPILQQPQSSFNPLVTLINISHSSTQSDHTNISDLLDFASLLKAAQTISSEIKLDELLKKLTQILLQNSGGDKCVLVLPQDGTWLVKAISTLEATELCSDPLDDHLKVPIKLIQYVKRTQSLVVINNLETDLPVIDNYLTQYYPKSILGLAILNQGQLAGILYLENRSTAGVFTSDRLTVINFLCTQAAISLLNARLYQQAQNYAQQLEKTQLQIIQSEKMSALGNLVAGVAHEINNPVGFISGNLTEVQNSLTDLIEHLNLHYAKASITEIENHAVEIDLEYILADLPKMIASMQMGCDRIKEISTSLRNFSRGDNDRPVPCQIHDCIDSTLLILKHRLNANDTRPKISIIKDYGDLPQIECFAGQLNQVFMNLLANAIDALEESNQGRSYAEIQAKPNQITIKTELSPEQQVIIRIQDNGKGMSQEVQQKIFEHLFTTKGVGKGTGLGLAIARQIIEEKHQGTIMVKSELRVGTEFILSLPIRLSI